MKSITVVITEDNIKKHQNMFKKKIILQVSCNFMQKKKEIQYFNCLKRKLFCFCLKPLIFFKNS